MKFHHLVKIDQLHVFLPICLIVQNLVDIGVGDSYPDEVGLMHTLLHLAGSYS